MHCFIWLNNIAKWYTNVEGISSVHSTNSRINSSVSMIIMIIIIRLRKWVARIYCYKYMIETGVIKTISLVPTLARVSINGHLHTTSTFACIQYIPTNHRHAVTCFMRGVTLQFWMLHRKQPRNDINFYLLLKSYNRVW